MTHCQPLICASSSASAFGVPSLCLFCSLPRSVLTLFHPPFVFGYGLGGIRTPTFSTWQLIYRSAPFTNLDTNPRVTDEPGLEPGRPKSKSGMLPITSLVIASSSESAGTDLNRRNDGFAGHRVKPLHHRRVKFLAAPARLELCFRRLKTRLSKPWTMGPQMGTSNPDPRFKSPRLYR